MNRKAEIADCWCLETSFSNLFSEVLEVLINLQKSIENLETKSHNHIKLSDVCHAPLHPEKATCNIQSIWAYWQDDIQVKKSTYTMLWIWAKSFVQETLKIVSILAQNNIKLSCAEILDPEVVLGQYLKPTTCYGRWKHNEIAICLLYIDWPCSFQTCA